MSLARLLAVIVLLPLLTAGTLTSATLTSATLTSAARTSATLTSATLNAATKQLVTSLATPTRPVPASVTGGPDWAWPIASPRRVIRAFEAPPTPYTAGHRGLDLATVMGTPVYAPATGAVSFAGMVAGRQVLSIAHAGSLLSSFEPVQAVVSAGESVSSGQLIGVVASGGHCAGTCLHFGVRLHGLYVSPMLVLGGAVRAVLLPLRYG
jgi:murein DD-endopeptidase MepM/ murein hydrolase activator NlpD